MTTFPFHRVAVFIISLFIATGWYSLAIAQTTGGPTVTNATTTLAIKVAPGEILPVSVKLSNFGGGSRVDVLVQYDILNSSGTVIYTSNETVAVETTNSFIKSIQIPSGTKEGDYSEKTSLIYQGQLTPATTQFSFKVEPKILGVFRSDFYLYGGLTLIGGILLVLLGHNLFGRRKIGRFAPLDYSNAPPDQRVFYELISDTILGMRQKVGDKALIIAEHIDGLVIDKHTGRVLQLTISPAKVVAELVAGYEKSLGKKVSFSFRNSIKENEIKE